MTANVAVVVGGIHWIWSLFQPLWAVHFFATRFVIKQVSGTIHIPLSTRVEVAQTEMKLGNIKVTKSYILFPFSLSYMGYKTLVLFTQRPPHPFLYLNFTTRGTREKAACQSILVSHVTKILHETTSSPVCVCVLGPDSEFVSCQNYHVSLILIKCSACCHTSKPSILVSVNMKLRSCSGFMDRSHS